MSYRAFLSYRSTDREWALKLLQSLKERGITDLFYDKLRLAAGDNWDRQLQAALRESQHFVVFWSSAANGPDGYVNEERKEFELFYYRPTLHNPATSRRMIFILLDIDGPPSARDIHAIADLRDAAMYARGAANVPDAVWTRVVDQVANALMEGVSAIPVGLVVLASTRDGMKGVPFDQKVGVVGSLRQALPPDLDRAGLLERYHARPEDWQPLGQDKSILDLMNELSGRVNTRLGRSPKPDISKLQVRWELPTPAFWTTSDAIEDEVRRWRDQPLVVVIDPLSLYDPDVRQRLDALSDNLVSGLATFIVLGTQPVSPTHTLVRSLVRGEARRLHQLLLDPELPLIEPRAGGAINIGVDEMQPLVLTAIGNYARQKIAPSTPPAPVIDATGLR
jgi:hypothetical protein